MAFLSSALHSLGIFEKISGIKEFLKNRLLAMTQHQDGAGGQQRKRPHTSETALMPASSQHAPDSPVLSPLRWGRPLYPLLPSPSPALFSSPPLRSYSSASLFLVCAMSAPPGFPSV